MVLTVLRAVGFCVGDGIKRGRGQDWLISSCLTWPIMHGCLVVPPCLQMPVNVLVTVSLNPLCYECICCECSVFTSVTRDKRIPGEKRSGLEREGSIGRPSGRDKRSREQICPRFISMGALFSFCIMYTKYMKLWCSLVIELTPEGYEAVQVSSGGASSGGLQPSLPLPQNRRKALLTVSTYNISSWRRPGHACHLDRPPKLRDMMTWRQSGLHRDVPSSVMADERCCGSTIGQNEDGHNEFQFRKTCLFSSSSSTSLSSSSSFLRPFCNDVINDDAS